MKTFIQTSILLLLAALIFNACRKDDDTPINPEEAIMTFTFKETTLPKAGIELEATTAELQKVFVDLGDGTFVPILETGKMNSSDLFEIEKPTKGPKVRIKGIVKTIDLFGGTLTAADVSQNIMLQELLLTNKYSTFTNVDLTKNKALKKVTFHSGKLTSLDLSQNTDLKYVLIWKMPLKSITFPVDNQIFFLSLSDCQFTQIDLSRVKNLTHLGLYDSPLTAVDVSKQTVLSSLVIQNTNITQLDVTANKNIEAITMRKNKISTLVLPATFPKLSRVECYSNRLNNAQFNALAATLANSSALNETNVYLTAIDTKDPAEQNVISVAVVNKIKAKGWKVLNANGQHYPNYWINYPGR